MKFVYGIALISVLIALCAEGQELHSKEGIDELPSIQRQNRSLKVDVTTVKPNIKNMTVLERWNYLDNKIKEFTSSAIKMVLPYVIQDNGDTRISPQCTRQIGLLISGMKRLKLWAMKFLDATGKMIDGGFDGSLSALGSYDECLDIEVLGERSKDREKVLFNGQYCTLELRLPLPPKTHTIKFGEPSPILRNFSRSGSVMDEIVKYADLMYFSHIHIGLCVPSGCSIEDVSQLSNQLIESIGFDSRIANCDTKQTGTEFTAPQIAFICITSFLLLLVVIGTVIGAYSHFSKTEFKSTGIKVLLCFNFITNFEKLVDTKSHPDPLGCFHGIRFLSITWIVLGHTYLIFDSNVFVGIKRASYLLTDYNFLTISNSFVSVDTFYFMGGFLACYLTIKFVKLEKHPFNITLYVVFRLWRIMPAYILTILVILAADRFGSGPIWHQMTQKYIQPCNEHWWKNLIFINNFFNLNDMCVPQSWYIASDFQLYIGSLIILIPMTRSARVGIALCVVAIIGCIIYTAVVTVVLEFPYFMTIARPDVDYISSYLGQFYFRPFIHIGPYCIGMLTGYLLATHPKLKIPPTVQVIGWCLAFISNYSVVYGIYDWYNGYEPSTAEGLLYVSLNKQAWALGLAWVVVCCSTGHGGIVNYILTWRTFIPLARLTYCVFLIHPVVQVIVMGNVRSMLFNGTLTFVYLFFGHLCISYILAFCMTMLTETPSLALQKLLKDSLKKKSDDTNASRRNITLKENLDTNKKGDMTMIVQDSYKEMRGVDNEAASYKL